jgi:uncharacterized protein
MNMSSEFLRIIACPASGGKLNYDKKRQVLINNGHGFEYPIFEGVPLLLESEARKIDLNEDFLQKDQIVVE